MRLYQGDEGFKTLYFYWSLWNDTTKVKGLRENWKVVAGWNYYIANQPVSMTTLSELFPTIGIRQKETVCNFRLRCGFVVKHRHLFTLPHAFSLWKVDLLGSKISTSSWPKFCDYLVKMTQIKPFELCTKEVWKWVISQLGGGTRPEGIAVYLYLVVTIPHN